MNLNIPLRFGQGVVVVERSWGHFVIIFFPLRWHFNNEADDTVMFPSTTKGDWFWSELTAGDDQLPHARANVTKGSDHSRPNILRAFISSFFTALEQIFNRKRKMGNPVSDIKFALKYQNPQAQDRKTYGYNQSSPCNSISTKDEQFYLQISNGKAALIWNALLLLHLASVLPQLL